MTFMQYVRLVAKACRLRRIIARVPSWLALAAVRAVEPLVDDVVLTREELGLEQELLLSHEPPRGRQSVAEWLFGHGEELGRRYVNDVLRHFGGDRSEPVLDPARPF